MTISDKVIITCAVTGAIHTPTMSPYLPITPDQIAEEAIAAAEAGAAILHLHARDPETGKPDQTPEAFARFLPRIKQGTNAAINITTGGKRIDQVRLPAGQTANWTRPLEELQGKTLYFDRWRAGVFGLPGTGGGSLVLWVPRTVQDAGHLELHVVVNPTKWFSFNN